jgi:hypothetical protein
VPLDVSIAEPRFTLDEVTALERPAWHLATTGDADYVYDGINFWCDRIGSACPLARREALPRQGWRHRADCHCPGCHEAVVVSRSGQQPQ